MRTENQRRSEYFEDRGTGRVRGGGGRLVGVQLISFVVRRFGVKGLLIVGALMVGFYLLAPDGVRSALGGDGGAVSSGTSVCDASEDSEAACDFSRVVLASTEDVWASVFQQGTLPRYRAPLPASYSPPTLVVFSDAVSTDGCGSATSEVGPFYCPLDRKLYIDPSFYDVMERQLRAPGDFAQAFVIAHEVGHHVQNLIGATEGAVPGESEDQTSVRIELQADCLAGVWGHTARASLSITDEDLDEALTAAHAIGDDALGQRDRARFTHGSSEQRVRWFRRGFETGDARQCDTFSARRP
ncbi:MAG: neutral zinc metallopeptidase [Sandaracinaceae bacterium]